MKIILWCEFPKQVNWKKAEKLIDFPIEIYIAVKDLKELKYWKKKTRFKLNPWPILDKQAGYWFSGFTNKKDIDKLKQFKNYNLKIDLEPPLPSWKYKTHRLIFYALKQLFKKGKNKDYLKKTIYNLSKKTKVELIESNIQLIANEFPLPRFYLERQGLFIKQKNNIIKNYMCYTSFAGSFYRPFLRFYLKIFMKRAVKKNKNTMFSIGLIGSGILKTEKVYKNEKQLKQDLEMVKSSGANKVAIYSLESLLKRKNPSSWLSIIKNYSSNL